MFIRSVGHRGLRPFLERNSPRLLKQDQVERVRNILTAVLVADDTESLAREAPSGWRVHRLSGTRHGQWSISVSGNWRITFEERDNGIERLNPEDYH